jgi:hypothetical protein
MKHEGLGVLLDANLVLTAAIIGGVGVRQAGRASTATDPAPTEMYETVINLKPKDQRRPRMTVRFPDRGVFPEVSKVARHVSRARLGSAGRLGQFGNRSGTGERWRMAWSLPWPPRSAGRSGASVRTPSNFCAGRVLLRFRAGKGGDRPTSSITFSSSSGLS